MYHPLHCHYLHAYNTAVWITSISQINRCFPHRTIFLGGRGPLTSADGQACIRLMAAGFLPFARYQVNARAEESRPSIYRISADIWSFI